MNLKLPRGLIVSCQAVEGEPLYNEGLMKFFARCAKDGGAVAIRALSNEIDMIKEEVNLPIIGLEKKVYGNSKVFITPTCVEIDKVLATNADVIAIDATFRARPDGKTLKENVEYIRNVNSNVQIMADISSVEEAIYAEELGFEYISTTLFGYTDATKNFTIPSKEFVRKCKNAIKHTKLIVEGGIWEKEQMEEILEEDPYAVVVGTAITRPKNITQRFNECFKNKLSNF